MKKKLKKQKELSESQLSEIEELRTQIENMKNQAFTQVT
jgi:hypothetical protein